MLIQIREGKKGLDSHGSNISIDMVAYSNMQIIPFAVSQITVIAQLQNMA